MKKIHILLFALLIISLGFAQTDPGHISFNTDSSTATDLASTNTGDTHRAERNADELIFFKLRASTNSNSYTTDFYFNDNASLGFDLGYDAAIFGTTPNFALYSNLVEDNVGNDISLQAVNTTDLADVTFPLGVNASSGQQLTISISTSTLPASVNVYLDDTVANTSTLLNNSDFIFTPATALSGTGRFFLRALIPPTTYTFNGSWSPTDPNGVAAAVDNIVIASGDATIIADTSCNTVTVNPGASITIDLGSTLTITNGLMLESNSTSYSSLIRNGSIVGTLNYERHININGSGTTGSNDLVSAPLTGQAFNAFATANPNILNNGTLYLFGPFSKDTGSYVTYESTETATLDPGVGYRGASDDNGTFTFTGTDNIGNVINDISNSGPNNAEWNLIGNPYPSYLNVQNFLLHDVGGAKNIELFDPPTAAIYGYDGSALNGWTIYNLANTTTSTVIAPGQGFFVSAESDNAFLYDLEFTPAMRSTGSGDDFISGRQGQLVFMTINMTTASDSYSTQVYFNSNATLGFDLGFDAEILSTSPPFSIYSHLVEDNEDEAIALQAINTNDIADTTISLGVNANQGEQLTISAAFNNIPATTEVYLDDTVAMTTTFLNTTDFVLTPNVTLSGTGRFFLRVFDTTLSTTENTLNTLSIFALHNKKEIVVKGQLQEDTVLSLYDIQGRKVSSIQLDNSRLDNRIDISTLSGGVYIVTIQDNSQQKSQKLVIN
ncbi:T9SS type A sorting domain-containing protein [Psychroserpens sp.]